jgi:hypothetical protein
MTRIFRIDNQIIERIGLGGCRISPIKLFERQHQLILNLDIFPCVTTGSRRLDSLLIQRIMDGGIGIWDELEITYPYLSLDLIVI